MRYQDFVKRAVEESVSAAILDYELRPEKKAHLEGSIAGLKACLDKSPPELAYLLERARKVHSSAFRNQTSIDRYWRVTCFMQEVEWICNVVSVVLMNQEMPGIIPPTLRGAQLAQKITLEQVENN